ncbi:MAG: putative Holliday junction resolvase [Firmicutes bacterium ADurb.Bin193]|nr:MAG: putative Holliday junction resolvase [Firmicutes bacterium ADurb.Bin193]
MDFGKARTGIAVSDPLGITAQGVETIFEKNPRKVAERVAALSSFYEACIIVVGLPKNMNNTIGERGKSALEFAESLRKLCSSCEVVMWDERLSTVSAIGILNETDTRGKKRKDTVDTVAAGIILQGYLDYKNKDGGNRI